MDAVLQVVWASGTRRGLVLQGRAALEKVGSCGLEKKSGVPFHRIWGHQVFNFMTNQVSGVSLTDSWSGFRAFSLWVASLLAV